MYVTNAVFEVAALSNILDDSIRPFGYILGEGIRPLEENSPLMV